jgi:hypothetical protein
LLTECFGELGKVTQEIRLLGSTVQKVTGDISDNKFEHKNRRKVSNFGRIISVNCGQKRKLFIPTAQYNLLLKDERQSNELRSKAVQ